MNVEATAELERQAAVHRALGDPHRLAIVAALRHNDAAPSDLRDLTGLDWNLLAHHLDTLTRADIIERRASAGDRRRRYLHLRHDTLRALGAEPNRTAPEPLLFICTRNSARSQFAAGLWHTRTGRTAWSAGSTPADRVHPLAIDVARTHNVDLTGAQPRGYDDIPGRPRLVISVCDRAREAHPPFDAPYLHWSIPDPVDGDRTTFAAALADIAERIDHLADDLAA